MNFERIHIYIYIYTYIYIQNSHTPRSIKTSGRLAVSSKALANEAHIIISTGHQYIIITSCTVYHEGRKVCHRRPFIAAARAARRHFPTVVVICGESPTCGRYESHRGLIPPTIK